MSAKAVSRSPRGDIMMLFATVTGYVFLFGLLFTPMIEKAAPFAGAHIIAAAVTTIAFIATVVTVMKMKTR